MNNQTGFLLAGESIIGLVRRHNEDNFLIAAPHSRRSALAVVADGVGGNRHGEIASFVCCRDFGKYFQNTTDKDLETAEQGKQFLEDTLEKINRHLFERNFVDRTLSPMSTVMVALLLTDHYAAAINIGDSRIYRASGGKVEQISTDHTLGGDPEFAWMRENKNQVDLHILTRSVGPKHAVPASTTAIALNGDERFCLCSDGFYGELSETQLHDILTAEAADPRQILDKGMRQVLLSGAHDNATAVCCIPQQKI